MTSSPLSRSGRLLVSRNLRFGQAARSPSTRSPTADSEVFAVVQHQQRGSVGDVVGEHLDLPRPVGALQTQCLGDGGAQELGLGDVGERHHPAPVAVSCAAPPRRSGAATRVFPTPPGPTRVTTRDDARCSRTLASSALRPTNEV